MRGLHRIWKLLESLLYQKSSDKSVLTKTDSSSIIFLGFYTVSAQRLTRIKLKLFSLQGDSGGPLFYQDANGQFIQFGALEFGHKCSSSSPEPDKYVSIPQFRSFIDSVISSPWRHCNIMIMDEKDDWNKINIKFF